MQFGLNLIKLAEKLKQSKLFKEFKDSKSIIAIICNIQWGSKYFQV